MLSEALELDRYTETVVHDLQTRLQPVLAHAQKLQQRLGQIASKGPQLEALEVTANELVRSIVALRVPIWNLGEYMPQYEFKYCPLAKLVEEAVALYGAEAERKEVEIRVELQAPSNIQMSRTHLQQAINNLMHNAIKYSFFGREDLERYMKVRGEVDGFDYVLTFSNYGIGILPEEFNLIFEPGYRGKLTSKEHRSGSGKGLTIAREVIEKHHGTIQVGSKKAGGEAYCNSFVVRLPHIQPAKEERK
jgi:signal transduction histidine kinase